MNQRVGLAGVLSQRRFDMIQSHVSHPSRVLPSMVASVFDELKSNGYSDAQVIALSAGLIEMARQSTCGSDKGGCEELRAALKRADFEYDLSMLGL
jgi:hypothetical protein